ncbi:hypothetical protein [Kordiimonas sp. SCSIO 12610]|uniref:dCTP deaminase domain-containing protein n=1 Tax=Kordiimonas sp. SCSIO 12610 TaxID=2829597 RepID=UPI00210D6F2D|nr:hypothetical protein [Kordiimonas sp. SCSIO 12610]UTW55400.1 hypothetical protein KFF44_00465 [Kordiimonas sp. SCSIO 12610]
MASILSEEQLKKEINDKNLIQSADVNCAEGIKYDFRLSNRILKSSLGGPINLQELPALERSKVAVDPGEVVFVLTEERINLSADVMITLSPKRKLSHEGVQILGGLCVDPLYQGHLLIGLYNFSSAPFLLKPGRKLIAGVFQRLTDVEKMEFDIPDTIIDDFPDELVNLIKNYQPVGTKDLVLKVDELSKELRLMKSLMDDEQKWRTNFEGYLEEHSKQIGDLLHGLRQEKDIREKSLKEERDSRNSQLTDMKRELDNERISLKAIFKVNNILLGIALIGVGIILRELWSMLIN